MRIISKPRLEELLFDAGISDVDCPADAYALPTLDWLTQEFFPALVADQIAKNLAKYKKGKNTCIRFARHAASFAGDQFAGSDEDCEAALALGIFEFVLEDGIGHMICILAVDSGPGEPAIIFFEPQPPPHLTTPIQKEGTSCLAEF
jgi:hypothetical protein